MRACLPISLRSDARNSLPMENAINPSATSDISDNVWTDSESTNPSPLMPNLPIKYGPIRTPAIRYAVTEGSLKGLKTLVIRSPTSSAIETDSNIFIMKFLR